MLKNSVFFLIQSLNSLSTFLIFLCFMNTFFSQRCESQQISNETLLFPADIYLLKINNGNTRKIIEKCLKLTTKAPEQHQ